MKQFLFLIGFSFLVGSLIAEEILADTLLAKEPRLKAGFSIGISQSNFLLTKKPDWNTMPFQNTLFGDTATFSSIYTTPGVFLNLGFFVSTKLTDKLELRINPLLRFNNAYIYYEIANGQTRKQASH